MADNRFSQFAAPQNRFSQFVQAPTAEPNAEADDPTFLGGIAQSIRGKKDPRYENAPSIQEQFDLRMPTVAAGVAGASDEQLADILQSQLGDKFVRRGKDANGNMLFVTRRDDGSEQVAYLNKPGLDRNDIGRGVASAIPYVATGVGAAALTAGRGLANVALGQGLAGGLTSIYGDVASTAMGSDEGIEAEKAALAAGLGAAGPVVGRAAGDAYQFVKNRVGGAPDALQEFGRGAVNRVGDLIQSDRLLSVDLPQRARQLGPEGMIGDMGDNLREATGALARVPGQNQRIVTDAVVRDRRVGAPDRIREGVNQALGQEGNQTAFVEAQRVARNKQAAPLYQQFHQMALPETGQLAATIDIIRRGVPGAFNEARLVAIKDGIDERFLTRLVDDPMTALTGQQTSQQGARIWTGAELDYLKRAVDKAANKAAADADRTGAGQLGGIARRLRTQVDEMISPDPQDATQSPWAQARAISGEGLEAEEALEQGSNVFTSKRDPFETQAQLDDLSAFGRDVFLRGARDDVRRTMGRASSAYGPTGDLKARAQFQNDFNQENLGIIAGPRAAERLGRVIDNETTFARTYDSVASNSATSAREAAKKAIPGGATNESSFAAEAGKKGPVGIATEAVFKFADALTNGAIGRRNEVLRTGMARLLTLRGAERDAAIAALNEIRAQRGTNAEVARVIDRAINALSTGARGPATSAVQD